MPASTRTASAPRRHRHSHDAQGPARQGAAQRLMNWLGLSIQVQGRGLRTRVSVKKLARAEVSPLFPGMVDLKPVSPKRLDAMRKDLRRLLRQHPQTKTLLRHLAFVEHTLRRSGLDEVDRLPIDVLSKALAQLEMLVTNWSAHGLGEMRSRLSILVKNKEIEAAHQDNSLHMTEIDASQRADVCEVSHSLFDEMDRSWRGQVPTAVATAAVAAAAASATAGAGAVAAAAR